MSFIVNAHVLPSVCGCCVCAGVNGWIGGRWSARKGDSESVRNEGGERE